MGFIALDKGTHTNTSNSLGFVALEKKRLIGINFNIMGFTAITCWVGRCFEVEDEVQEALADKRRRLLTGVGVVPAEVLAQRSLIAMTQTG